MAILGVWSPIVVRNRSGRTGHGGVVGYALAVAVFAGAVLLLCDQSSGTSSTSGTELLILIFIILLLPESSLAVAGCVVVRWAGAVTLVPLTCAAEDDFESC